MEVPAFTGLYPFFRGWGDWELLFTRHRLLTLCEDQVLEGVARGGHVRGQLLREDHAPQVELAVSRRRYDRLRVAGRTFWVHRRYRDAVQQRTAGRVR